MTCIVIACGAKQTSTTDFCKSHEATWKDSPERGALTWKDATEYYEAVGRFAARIYREELVEEENVDEID